MKQVNIAIIGFGTVGRGCYNIINDNSHKISKSCGCQINVKKIYDRSYDKKAEIYALPKTLKAENPNEIFNDKSIQIVVEAIGGIDTATEYMLSSMKNGKHVVTPNKAAVAENLHILTETAKENDVKILMEACVGGGIPVLSSIQGNLSANNFNSLSGIVNGTTNYILTQMEENGLSYDEALKQAQAKGFAEADPTTDVEGIDSANKLSILMYLAFDKYIKPSHIPTEGITSISIEDIKEAKAKNQRIKLLATATKDKKGDMNFKVAPTAISISHPLAGVKNEFNAIYLDGDAVGEVMLYGKGAGSLPTGSAVVGDIVEIAKSL